MKKEQIKKQLKTKLEQIQGIRNVKFHNGNFRGDKKQQAYLEFNLTNKDYEPNTSRLCYIISQKIKINFPEISIDYTNPNSNNNPNNLRRITLNITEQKKPCEKEKLIYDVAQEFNHIIQNYLLIN